MSKINETEILKTREHIHSRWPLALKYTKQGDKFALPNPFVPPCIDGDFHVLFYWDTFYTNRGMIADGYFEYAKYNVDNLIFMLDKLGFIPNAYNEELTKWSSQPPYLHFMIRDIYEYSHDDAWLNKAYIALKKEYDFWMKERIAPNGLNRHYHNHLPDVDFYDYYDRVVKDRLGLPNLPDGKKKAILGECYCAVAESGLDFSPRFRDRGIFINPVDLNANIYGMELDLAWMASKLEKEKEDYYLEQARNRKERMEKYMLKEDGLFYDYDFEESKIYREDYCFSGQFMPYVTNLSKNKKGLDKLLSRLFYPFGIVSTQEDKDEKITYQASFPYSWPYDNYLAYWGLKQANEIEKAKEVGETWLNNIASTYIATGKLWETYDPFKGGRAEKKEYPANEMMGWTAGSFSSIANNLGFKIK